ADTSAAVVHWGSIGAQRTVEAPLRDLPEAVQRAGVTAPAIIIIGSVTTLRSKLGWFEDRPLFGKRVLVTRPRHQAEELIHRLEEIGAVPVVMPAVELGDPADWGPVDGALADLGRFQWLVFTSANGVHAFVKRLRQIGRDLRAFGTLRLAAIGPVTADALRSYHLEPDLVPAQFRSEELAEALRPQVAGQRVLLAPAHRGRELLRQELAAVADIEQIAVYSQIDAIDPASDALDQLRRGEIEFVTLTSSNIARAVIRALDEPCRALTISGHVKIVTISPVT